MTQSLTIPHAACRLVTPLQFADSAPPTPTPPDQVAPPTPIKLMARDTGALEHWFWGRIVHDMAGAILPARCQLDWGHDRECPEGLLGFAENLKADPAAGLTADGTLLPLQLGDTADRVAKLGRQGVPFTCSLDWSCPGAIFEEVPAGATAEANGQTFTGPVVIVRRWEVNAIAICNDGADPACETSFSANQQANRMVAFVSESPPLQGKPMNRRFTSTSSSPPPAAPATGADPAEKPADNPAPTGETKPTDPPTNAPAQPAQPAPPAVPAAAAQNSLPATIATAELQRFVATFGAERGPQLLLAGQSFEAALQQEFTRQRDELTSLQKQIAAAQKLTASTPSTVQTLDAKDAPASRQGKTFIRIAGKAK